MEKQYAIAFHPSEKVINTVKEILKHFLKSKNIFSMKIIKNLIR